MKNKAKCKSCASIIESCHATDYVQCKCGKIAVLGGSSMRCAAEDWNQFVRIDDENKEIPITVHENKEDLQKSGEISSRDELINMLENKIETFDHLPAQAMQTPVTHYDLQSILILFSEILKAR